MNKLVFLTLLSLTAYQPMQEIDDGFIEVSESQWAAMNNINPFPFTVNMEKLLIVAMRFIFLLMILHIDKKEAA